jgi:hypothetical protein
MYLKTLELNQNGLWAVEIFLSVPQQQTSFDLCEGVMHYLYLTPSESYQ